jgi:hypothetical protein
MLIAAGITATLNVVVAAMLANFNV